MVGFDKGEDQDRRLDAKPVCQINSDLTSRVDVTAAVPLPENEGICFLGMMKAGPFDIDQSRLEAMIDCLTDGPPQHALANVAMVTLLTEILSRLKAQGR